MVLGITGGVGSGKSLVLELLRSEFGFTVLQTDILAKVVMAEDAACRNALKKAFGEAIFLPDGAIDKVKFASLIYADDAARRLTDSIVHPAVWREAKQEIEKIQQSEKTQDKLQNKMQNKTANIALETALPEPEFFELCDTVWYIHVDKAVRIARLMASRGYAKEKCLAMIKSQPDEIHYRDLADVVIHNSGTKEETLRQMQEALYKQP